MAERVYVGVADCYGIDLIFPRDQLEKGRIQELIMRAMCNRHRHSIFFSVTIEQDKIEEIISNLKQTGGSIKENALKKLKEFAVSAEIPKEMRHSWRMIPNPELDPFYRGGE